MISLLNSLPPPQGHLSEGYGKLCSIYLKLLITKMEFHIKVSCPDPQRQQQHNNSFHSLLMTWCNGASAAVVITGYNPDSNNTEASPRAVER